MKVKPISALILAALTSAAAPFPEGKSHLAVRALGSDREELVIYGPIGTSWWDESVSARAVVDQLNEITAKNIDVRINSVGGSVVDGIAIYNALRRKSKAGHIVNTHNDGLAASIASLIMMAGETAHMPENTLMMVHAPWGFAMGNSAEMREYADVLDVYGAAMAKSYARKTGKPASHFEGLFSEGKDHWYTAEQAKAEGLVDVIPDDDSAADDGSDDASQASAIDRILAGASMQVAAQARRFISKNPPSAPAVTVTQTSAQASGLRDGNSLEINMPNSNPQAGASNTDPNQTVVAEAVQTALAAERERIRARNENISAVLENHMDNPTIRALHDRAVADPDMTIEQVNASALAALGSGVTSAAGNQRIEAGADSREKFRTAAINAIQSRAGIVAADGANEMRGLTLFEMARSCAERAGVRTSNMSRMDVVGAAFTHSTSDFPLLLGDAARRSLLLGYSESEEIYDRISRPVTLTDFKESKAVGLGQFSDLDKVGQSGEYKYGTFGEHGQSIRLVTFGKMFSLSRQAVINDDLGAFTAIPNKMGRAAKRTIGNEVIKLLTSNPTLDDGVALFHATHKNIAASGVISTATVQAMKSLMALQAGANGERIRIPLKYLLVPVGLSGLAQVTRASQYQVDAAGNSSLPNIVQNTFEVLDDPRLDDNSATKWYGVADPAMYDGLLIGYLDGNQAPYMEQRDGWTVDGIDFKVRLDAGAAIGSHLGLARNAGT